MALCDKCASSVIIINVSALIANWKYFSAFVDMVAMYKAPNEATAAAEAMYK